ncbi:hypothetical protein SAMN06265220_103559 [Flavobacterium nitrogenifigens]|uniref:Uncharacterized protein n=1 Tax=Flavobacterium nitrogenifigens TaxID=1617283 RepID=A0A521DW99_9FLAO|nr:hypothetical protein SAMN06265220_103559 [Flavobacterium nitrogenifigens]
MLNLNQRLCFFNKVLILTYLENVIRNYILFQYLVFNFFTVVSAYWDVV